MATASIGAASGVARAPDGRSLLQLGCGGVLFGASVAFLEFAYYYPLVASPDAHGGALLLSLLLSWCGEGALFAVILGLFELRARPRPLGAGELVLAVAVAAIVSVFAWQDLVQLVLRERFGIRLLRDYVGQPVNVAGVVIYHVWLMLVFGGLAAALHSSRQRHVRMLAALREAELDRESSQRKLVEAKLAALKARIDPEFLVQTLGRLEHLYGEADPAGADRLLEELIAFLRSAIADVRAGPAA